MPRRHTPAKHTPYVHPQNEKGKVRYATKQAAEKAAELRMLENMNLELSVYRGADGGWYMTSKSSTHN